jgi:hypothetical protein
MNKYAPQAAAYAEAHGWPNPGPYGTTADVSKLHGLLQVQTPDGPFDVWGAPSTQGNLLCYVEGFESDLAPGADHNMDAGCTQPGGLAANYGIEVESEHPDVYLTSGYTDNADAATAQVTIQVGQDDLSRTGPVVDGFYVVAFPRDPTATGASDDANIGVLKVVTDDASGKELETWQNPWQIPCPAVKGPCKPRTP